MIIENYLATRTRDSGAESRGREGAKERNKVRGAREERADGAALRDAVVLNNVITERVIAT